MKDAFARLAIPFVTLVATLILTACGGGHVSPTLSDNGIAQDAEIEQPQSEPVPEPVSEAMAVTAENKDVVELRHLAEQDDAEAQWILGAKYSEALGVPQDHAEARKWYRLAAEQGHDGAQNALKGETWRCFAASDYNKTTALFTLTRVRSGSREFGEVSVAGTTYSASFRIAGLNRRWHFGYDESGDGYPYAFVIEPDGTGLYYDFSTSSDGTTKPRDFFKCLMSP